MIGEGERKGALSPDKLILDATSGNTGIAYAMIAAARGYRVKAVHAEQRHAGAKTDSARVWRRARLYGSDGRLGMVLSGKRVALRRDP